MWSRLLGRFKACLQSLSPSKRTWHGAAWALLIVAATLWVATGFLVFRHGLWTNLGTWLLFFGLTIVLPIAGLLVRLVLNLLKARDPFFSWTLAPCLVVLAVVFISSGGPGMSFTVAATVSLCAAFIGGGIAALTSGTEWRKLSTTLLVVGVATLMAGAIWLSTDGPHRDAPPNAASAAKLEPLALPNPSLPGPYKVRTLTYGSGSDLRRPEYASGAAIKTKPVDGSLMLPSWKGRAAWARTRYWGFDSKKLPLQARVWYPEGDGPFPLALIVHGNHSMEDFSDPGYGYLGELMASRGIIFASVDENFLNSSLSDLLGAPEPGLQRENNARGWLLLEHVRQWKEFNQTAGNVFNHRVDTEHIALLGHSRGGEAVAIAAVFNRLPYYPDNARLKLGYNHAIRGVVAIAPVDGQYKPVGIPSPVENVSYFVLHGAADGDVQSFHGSLVYHRLKFTDHDYHFASTLYINDANHGQFNTVWGRFDNGDLLGARFLNYGQIRPAEEQRQIAKVYISAYLEAILHGQIGYLPLFRDHRVAPGWLPAGIYLHEFKDSNDQMVATFEEDIDPTTTTLPGGKLWGDKLCDWKERTVKLKWNDNETRAVVLGWNTKESKQPGSYTITLPDKGLTLTAKNSLIFEMSDAKEDPSPFDPNKKDDDKKDKKPDKDDKKKDEPIELSIEVTDASGQSARLPLSTVARLQRQIPTHVMKFDWMASTPRFEPLFQSFEFPLESFIAGNPKLDPATLRTVRFVFDRTESGVILLDDVGFRLREGAEIKNQRSLPLGR